MRSAKVMILCVCFTLPVAKPTLAQKFDFTFRGVITAGANHNPSLNTRIRLQRFGRTVYETFVRNSSFEFRNVEAGRYTLVADDPDYETVQQEIDVPGGGSVINFRPR